MGELVVGFDLDMTLVDTSESILAAFAATAQDMRIGANLTDVRSRLGLPIQEEFARYLSPERAGHATNIFRGYLKEMGARGSQTLPGAAESIRYVRRIGARSLVLTAKHTPLAASLLGELGLDVDNVIGGLDGPAKAHELREAGAWGYVGDHANDMRAASAAGAAAIGVATGNASAQELIEAGADFAMASLETLPVVLHYIRA